MGLVSHGSVFNGFLYRKTTKRTRLKHISVHANPDICATPGDMSALEYIFMYRTQQLLWHEQLHSGSSFKNTHTDTLKELMTDKLNPSASEYQS